MAEPSTSPHPEAPLAWMKPLRAPIEMLGELSLFFAQSVAKFTRTREDVKTWADLLELDDFVSFGGKA